MKFYLGGEQCLIEKETPKERQIGTSLYFVLNGSVLNCHGYVTI